MAQIAGGSPARAAPICIILALTAHRTGDGTLANVALDRALANNRDYPGGR